jgi:hypothetical protein
VDLQRKKNAKKEVYKARLVAEGYIQKQRIDYNEVFSLVARFKIIRLIIVTAAQHR